MHGNSFTLAVLGATAPACWLLFALLPARRAVIVAVIVGWLVLPLAIHPIQGLPEITKASAVLFGVYSGILLFDRRRLLELRLHWVDVPLLVFTAGAALSSLSNGLGVHDALSATFNRALFWGGPYVLGRLYCADLAGLRDLAIGFVCGGLAYVPLCLLETQSGPLLHGLVYGYQPHDLEQAMHFGGWRPVVFLENGLAVALWMVAATLAAGWLWASRAVERLLGASMLAWALLLAMTTVVVKSMNGWMLMLGGSVVLWCVRRGYLLPLLMVLVTPSVYVGARVATDWSGRELVRATLHTAGVQRAQSLQFRFQQERRLMRRAAERRWLGWGGGSAWRLHDAQGRDISVSDSRWIIALGPSGLIGLASLLAMQVLPILAFLRRWPAAELSSAAVAPALVLAVVVALRGVDECFNAQMAAMYFTALGGLGVCRPQPRTVVGGGREGLRA